MKLVVVSFIIAGVVAVALLQGRFESAEPLPSHRLASVSRGPIISAVAASGALRAALTVDVGTQVSGLIKSLHADFNSEVEAGQVIARLDSAPFEAQLKQAEAELAVARASVVMQEAALEELEAELDGHRAALVPAAQELRRKRALAERKAVSSSVVDAALADHARASAQVRAGVARLAKQRAQIDLARARVLQETAAVHQRRLDLEYTYIRSPVKGVVIRRDVDPGQTVAASLQAPVLFRIAKDLRHMEVNINVDEADIGRVETGQRITFTVDTFPERLFEGQVREIRKTGEVQSNVVTYTVVASADNVDGRLLPGMTATVNIVVAEREDALKVPNAALSLRLSDDDGMLPESGSWIWVVQDDGAPVAVPVIPGISDGHETEVTGDGLESGRHVITGIEVSAAPQRWSWPRFGF